ncbi:secreted protein [Bathymodiolus azoricus thioautotrophic gill symbiont]|uniref:Secreted protein n=1 Tax=Bathymodiolus azoricus thioautotrophic gill symbiont TaxID=235205 RepID=A0A1H6KT50_9GAMM|nr:secreted protein [Bathymodiolus azoricus thioautotrophic gill symbiont]
MRRLVLLIWILVGATSFRSVTVTVMVLLTEDSPASLAVIITE